MKPENVTCLVANQETAAMIDAVNNKVQNAKLAECQSLENMLTELLQTVTERKDLLKQRLVEKALRYQGDDASQCQGEDCDSTYKDGDDAHGQDCPNCNAPTCILCAVTCPKCLQSHVCGECLAMCTSCDKSICNECLFPNRDGLHQTICHTCDELTCHDCIKPVGSIFHEIFECPTCHE